MKLLARWLAEQLSKAHQNCLRSLIKHDAFVISCSPLNSYCQDNQFAVWRRRTWTAHNNEHYTKIIHERITWIFCLKRELHNEFEWEWQVDRTCTQHSQDNTEAILQGQHNQVFRICRCSENYDSWENSTSPLGAWTRPEIRTKQNNHISICFVLELNRVHSTTTICVTMLTRPLSRVSVEKLIKKTIIAWILILTQKKNIPFRKIKINELRRNSHWFTSVFVTDWHMPIYIPD